MDQNPHIRKLSILPNIDCHQFEPEIPSGSVRLNVMASTIAQRLLIVLGTTIKFII